MGGKDGVAVIEGLHDIPDKVHELIGFRLTGKAADLHDTTDVVDKTFLLTTPDNGFNLSAFRS